MKDKEIVKTVSHFTNVFTYIFYVHSLFANGERKYADSERSRSSMETLILSCLQAQLLTGRINSYNIPRQIKNDLIWEIKQVSPNNCKISIDAKADGRNAL